MANAFTLFGEIKLDTSQLNSGLSQAETRIGKTKTALDGLEGSANRAGTGVNSFGSSASSSGNAVGTFTGKLQAASGKLDSIGGAFLAAGASLTAAFTVPLTGLAYAAVNTSKDLQSLEMGLTAVTGSADEAKKQMAQLKEVAKLPGLGMKEALQGAINLQATGLSAETSQRALKAFGNALATVGKGKADLQGVITALSQIQSKGKVSAEEINQIAERVPQIRKVMQEAFGTADTTAIQKMGMTTDAFLNGIIAKLEELPPVATSAQGEIENFGDAVDLALKPIGDAILPILIGAMQQVQPVITALSETFANLSPELQTIILAVGAIVAAIGPLLVIIGTLALSISSIITLVQLLTPLFAGFGAAVSASFLPVIATIAAVVAAGYLLYKAYQTNFAGIKDIVDGAISAVIDAFNAAKAAIQDFWNTNGPAIMQAGQAIADFGAKVFQVLEPVIAFLIDNLAIQFKMIWGIVKAVFKGIWDVISNAFMLIVNLINGDFKGAWESFKGIFRGVLTAVSSILSTLYDYFASIFSKMFGLVGDAASWMFEKIKAVGKALIDGFVSAIQNGFSAVTGIMKSFGEMIINTVKSFLGIASPSKVFAGIGQNVVQGFADGINANKAIAQEAVSGLIDVAAFASKGKGEGEKAALQVLGDLINENKRLQTVGLENLTILEMTDAKFKGVTAETIKRIIAEKELKAAIENRLSTEERVKGILQDMVDTAYPQELSNIEKIRTALAELEKANGKVNETLRQRAILGALNLDLAESERKLAETVQKGALKVPEIDTTLISDEAQNRFITRIREMIAEVGQSMTVWQKLSGEFAIYKQAVLDGLVEMQSKLPSWGESFVSATTQFVEGIGNVFVDAVNNWDGTLSGFFKNVAIGFGKMIQQILSDLARLAIQKLVLQLLSSAFSSIGGGTITAAEAAAQGVDLSFPDFSGLGLSPTMGGAIGNAPTMGMMPSLAGVTNNSSSSVTNNNVNVNVSGAVGNNQQTGQMIQKQVIAALRKTERRTR